MYICVCHAFTDKDVRCLGAASVGEAYRSLGVRPHCGKCVPFVSNIVRGGEQQDLTRCLPVALNGGRQGSRGHAR